MNFTRLISMRCVCSLICVLSVSLTIAESVAQSKKHNVLLLIADDWSSDHAGIYGDRTVKTPNIDAIGREGAVFTNSFTASPSCTPSRAAILTGRFPHALEQGASLWGYLPRKFMNYTEILAGAGYHVGLNGKGWGPGNFSQGGYEINPAGKTYKDFSSFLEDRPAGKPFVFWFGSQNPHRPYEPRSGAASGMNVETVKVPDWLPDTKAVRNDILDYYLEVEQFDRQVGEIISALKSIGEFDNTLIIITSDNGMPFPRAKANLYDSGTRIPLIITLRSRIDPGRIDDFASLTDLAPTILELAGEHIPEEMSGSSLLPVLRKQRVEGRDIVFSERERHANVRVGDVGYPSRAVRTKDFLYIRNYEPERWPAGDPVLYHSVGPFGDIDDSPSKQDIMNNRSDPATAPFFERAFAKRPTEELYDLRSDPHQLKNVAAVARYKSQLSHLRGTLHDWQKETGDPRASGRQVGFDQYPYFGPPVQGAPSNYKPQVDK